MDAREHSKYSWTLQNIWELIHSDIDIATFLLIVEHKKSDFHHFLSPILVKKKSNLKLSEVNQFIGGFHRPH